MNPIKRLWRDVTGKATHRRRVKKRLKMYVGESRRPAKRRRRRR